MEDTKDWIQSGSIDGESLSHMKDAASLAIYLDTTDQNGLRWPTERAVLMFLPPRWKYLFPDQYNATIRERIAEIAVRGVPLVWPIHARVLWELPKTGVWTEGELRLVDNVGNNKWVVVLSFWFPDEKAIGLITFDNRRPKMQIRVDHGTRRQGHTSKFHWVYNYITSRASILRR